MSLGCLDGSQGHGTSVSCRIETHTCLTAHFHFFLILKKYVGWVFPFYCGLTTCYWDVCIFVNILCANAKLLPCISVFCKLLYFHSYLFFCMCIFLFHSLSFIPLFCIAVLGSEVVGAVISAGWQHVFPVVFPCGPGEIHSTQSHGTVLGLHLSCCFGVFF